MQPLCVHNRLLCWSLQELKQLRGMIDEDPRLFTAEIILNLLLSYRDIQVSGMCSCRGLLI